MELKNPNEEPINPSEYPVEFTSQIPGYFSIKPMHWHRVGSTLWCNTYMVDFQIVSFGQGVLLKTFRPDGAQQKDPFPNEGEAMKNASDKLRNFLVRHYLDPINA